MNIACRTNYSFSSQKLSDNEVPFGDVRFCQHEHLLLCVGARCYRSTMEPRKTLRPVTWIFSNPKAIIGDCVDPSQFMSHDFWCFDNCNVGAAANGIGCLKPRTCTASKPWKCDSFEDTLPRSTRNVSAKLLMYNETREICYYYRKARVKCSERHRQHANSVHTLCKPIWVVVESLSSFVTVIYLNFSKWFLKYNKRKGQRMRASDDALT